MLVSSILFHGIYILNCQIMSPFNFFVHFLYVVTSSSGIVEELQGAGDYFLDGWFFILFFLQAIFRGE